MREESLALCAVVVAQVVWNVWGGRREEEEEGAAIAYIRASHPATWLLFSHYDGTFSPKAFKTWSALRRLQTPTEAATYLRGHSEGDGGISARPSSITQAGDGLFATRRFRKGELICTYRGKKLSLAAVNRLDLAAGERDYVMGGFGILWHVDARESSCMGRYINDTFDGEHNVWFDKLKQDFAAKVIAKRDIAAGEELFVQYGEPFWKPRGIPHPYKTG